MSRLTPTLVLIFTACLLTPAVFAQSITGTLTGTVSDQHGAVIPRASVTLRNEASGDVRRTVANQDGYFTIAAVPAGRYTVTIEMAGFQKYEQKSLVFNGEDKRNVDAVLAVGNAAQTD